MVDAPVEGKQEFKLVFRIRAYHILTGYLPSDNLLSRPLPVDLRRGLEALERRQPAL